MPIKVIVIANDTANLNICARRPAADERERMRAGVACVHELLITIEARLISPRCGAVRGASRAGFFAFINARARTRVIRRLSLLGLLGRGSLGRYLNAEIDKTQSR